MRIFRTDSDERGIALALVLFALMITAALVTGVFVVARLEQRMGDNSVASTQAMAAAEAGVETALGNWNTADNSMAVNSSRTFPTVTLGNNTSYSVVLRRLNPTLFLVTSDGQTRTGTGAILTRRQVGMLARLLTPLINMNAAITTRVGIDITGHTAISGTDSVPPTWGGSCPPPGAAAPGIRDSSGNVTTSGSCSGASCISGSPQILTDPTIGSSDFSNFGNVNFSQLAAMANLTISGTMNGIGPVVAAGTPPTCTTSVSTNWGDPLLPTSPCFNYFPILYAPGNVTINGGIGQGILLVQGDLRLEGGVEFYGPVIVQGSVVSAGTGGHILGGLMANNADLDVTALTGNSVVGFSRCAINRALNATSRARPLTERSWAQLY